MLNIAGWGQYATIIQSANLGIISGLITPTAGNFQQNIDAQAAQEQKKRLRAQRTRSMGCNKI